MDLTSRKVIKSTLKKYRIRPSKKLGQNFLIGKRAIKKIITAANLQSNDLVLEIGPGLGTLTQELTKRVKRVIAIEKDPRMVEILRETMSNFKNIKIIQDDILKVEICKLFKNSYKVVASLPFYLTAPVIRKFLEKEKIKPLQMVLVIQKEVAQRICAKPPEMNLLAVSVQFYAQPEIISFISKKSFWPPPKVEGAIIKISPKKILWDPDFNNLFFQIIKAGFSQPRKIIVSNLSKQLRIDRDEVKTWLLKTKIQPTQRAENLKIEDWLNLAKSFKIKLRCND